MEGLRHIGEGNTAVQTLFLRLLLLVVVHAACFCHSLGYRISNVGYLAKIIIFEQRIIKALTVLVIFQETTCTFQAQKLCISLSFHYLHYCYETHKAVKTEEIY